MGYMRALQDHKFQARLAQLLVILRLLGLAATAPTLALPINSQVPPVARVDKPYKFIFAESTFSDNSSGLQYAIEDAPAWIRLDDFSQAFSGTPETGDLGPITFTLTASDISGSASDTVTFVVSDNPGPGLGRPVTEQLAAFGSTSELDTLLLYPASSLSVELGFDTFTNTDSTTNYYALCANNTPLPSWMHFNPADLSFSGTTPSFDSPHELPQEFDVHLTASDVAGFSAAIVNFHIVIGLHQLTFGSQQLVIDATSEQNIEYSGLQNALTLDGSAIKPQDLRDISLLGPKWLSLDPTSLEISGISPDNLEPQALVVTAQDVYGDVANTTVFLSTGSSNTLVIGSIPHLHAAIGEHFLYTFSRSLFPLPNVSIEVDLGNASSWLQFDPDSWTLDGVVPSNTIAQTDTLNLTASRGPVTTSTIVSLDIVTGDGSSSSPSSALGSFPSSTSKIQGPTSLTASGNTNTSLGSDAQKVAVVVILPIVGILALLFCIWLIRRRRKSSGEGGEKRSLLSRLRPPEMIIGEPQDFERAMARSRPTSARWSLPKIDLQVPIFTIPLDRNRHSQLIPPERMPRSQTQTSRNDSTGEPGATPSSPDPKSSPLHTPTSKRSHATSKKSLRTPMKASKISARSPQVISRPHHIMRRCIGPPNELHPMHGLGHGQGTPLPYMWQELGENQRGFRFDSHSESGMGRLPAGYRIQNRHQWQKSQGNRTVGLERQPSNGTNTTDANWTTSEESTEAANERSNLQSRRVAPPSSIYQDEHGRNTVRLVSRSPSSGSADDADEKSVRTSPMAKREKYLRERRQINKDSTLFPSKSLQRLSSWTNDWNREDRGTISGFSSIPRGSLSAQRKGQMMQKDVGSSGSNICRVLNRFQSANSIGDDPRFEDLEETDYSGNATELIWEDDEPNEYGEKVWKKTDEASSSVNGGQGNRLSMRRLSWLMG